MGGNERSLEHYLGEFESAYLSDGYVDMFRFLPPTNHPQYKEIVVEMMRCDMELCWLEQGNRRLNYYLEHFADVLKNDQNLDQVAFEEYRLRNLAGENVSREQYKQMYRITTNHWPSFENSHEEQKPDIEPNRSYTFSAAVADSQIETKPQKTDPRFSGKGGSASGIPYVTTLEGRLHKRLRFIGLTFSILLVYLQSLVFLNPTEKVGLFLGNSFLVVLNAICLFACVLITLYLMARPSIPLPRLRMFEVCLFGLVLIETSAG